MIYYVNLLLFYAYILVNKMDYRVICDAFHDFTIAGNDIS